MSSVQFTTSSTGVTLGPGIIQGVLIAGSTQGTRILIHDAASTTAGGLVATIPVPKTGTGYLPLGGLACNTNTFIAAGAAYGGITVMYQ